MFPSELRKGQYATLRSCCDPQPSAPLLDMGVYSGYGKIRSFVRFQGTTRRRDLFQNQPLGLDRDFLEEYTPMLWVRGHRLSVSDRMMEQIFYSASEVCRQVIGYWMILQIEPESICSMGYRNIAHWIKNISLLSLNNSYFSICYLADFI